MLSGLPPAFPSSFQFTFPLLLLFQIYFFFFHLHSSVLHLSLSGVKWRIVTKATPSKEHATVSGIPITDFSKCGGGGGGSHYEEAL